jgi:hypothetical protein
MRESMIIVFQQIIWVKELPIPIMFSKDHKELPIFMKESTMNWWFYSQSFDVFSKISKLRLYTKIGSLIFENHDYES